MVGVVKHFVGRREERVLAADQVTQLERVEDRNSNSAAACPALSNSCATVIFLIRFSSGRRGLERHPACPDSWHAPPRRRRPPVLYLEKA